MMLVILPRWFLGPFMHLWPLAVSGDGSVLPELFALSVLCAYVTR